MNRAYDIITDRILAMLNEGTVPWRQSWETQGKALNAFSHRPYRGVNALITALSEFADPRWATFNQVKANGGFVNAGAKATPVVFWKQLEVETDDPDEGTVTRTIPLLRLYHIFNVKQTSGLTLPALPTAQPVNKIEAAEKIVAGMPNPPGIAQDGGDRAYYRPSSDGVHMPAMGAFKTSDDYYAVLFHELTHSTGHKSRLDRGLSDNLAPFGSPDYSKEELVAELGSAFLSNEAGVHNDLPNSAAYIANWLKVLRNDKAMVIHAAARAQKAADYILGLQKEAQA